MIFKNRGHFCNYCRKIIWNKISVKYKEGKYKNQVININESIWNVWNSNNKDYQKTFINELSCIKVNDDIKMVNKELRNINIKYNDKK